jgi:hypothetical protein
VLWGNNEMKKRKITLAGRAARAYSYTHRQRNNERGNKMENGLNLTGMRVALAARFGADNVRTTVIDGVEWVEIAGTGRNGQRVWHRAGRVNAM